MAHIRKNVRYFVKCNVDGFVDYSRPYGQLVRAMAECQRLDIESPWCAPHTVAIADMYDPTRETL